MVDTAFLRTLFQHSTHTSGETSLQECTHDSGMDAKMTTFLTANVVLFHSFCPKLVSSPSYDTD